MRFFLRFILFCVCLLFFAPQVIYLSTNGYSASWSIFIAADVILLALLFACQGKGGS